MRPKVQPANLVALVADRDIEETLARLFGRPESLGVRQFPFDLRRHPDRDAGCRVDAANFLRQFLRSHRHALVVFDQEGCGSTLSREEIEGNVESELSRNGWGDRARAVVIDPELEAWVWSGSPVVATALGWEERGEELRSWLGRRGFWKNGKIKPDNPKAAMNQALQGAPRATRRRRSARIFGDIAAGVPVEGCQDPAFRKLKATLREWRQQADAAPTVGVTARTASRSGPGDP